MTQEKTSELNPGISYLSHIRKDVLKIHPRFFLSSCLHLLAMFVPFLRLRLSLYRLRGTTIEKNVYIGPLVFLEEIYPELIIIKEHCTIGPRVMMITHHSIFHHVDPKAPAYTAPVIIGKNCYIGSETIILPGVTIGDDTIIGVGSVVTRSIPSGSVAMGVPARVTCTRDEWLRNHAMNGSETIYEE
jgi:acetyltransferase-like isoleucine patch superfamily enzyme